MLFVGIDPYSFAVLGGQDAGVGGGGLHGAIPVEGSWSRPKEATGDMEEPGKALIAVDLEDERGAGIRVVAEGGGASCGLRREGAENTVSPMGGRLGPLESLQLPSIHPAAHFFCKKEKSQNTRASAPRPLDISASCC